MTARPHLKDSIPPHSEDAERAALGAMLLDGETVATGVSALRSEDFYSLANGKIFSAIRSIYDKNDRRVDIISVCNELAAQKQLEAAGGEGYVSSLTTILPTAKNIDYYASVVKENATRRALITVASKIIAKAHDVSENASEILEKAQHYIYELINEREQFKYRPVKEIVHESFEVLEAMLDKEHTGIRSGFANIDNITRGFQKSEMIIIGARPSIGKTALALNMAANIAFKQKVPAGFFSLEMRDTQLAIRLLSSEAQVDLSSVRKQIDAEKKHSFSKLQDAGARFYNAPLFIEDASNMKLLDLRTQARHMRASEKVEIIFIDYLGLIDNQNNLPRYEQVSEISRSLKGLARELQIPIVILSQVSRAVEGKQPSIADLRDSGSIEQDADVVMLLHRERKPEDDSDSGHDFIETKLDIAKNRNGPTGVVSLAYRPKYTRFDVLEIS